MQQTLKQRYALEMSLNMKQRSALVQAAERGLDRKRSGYKILAGCFVGMVLIVILAAAGVV